MGEEKTFLDNFPLEQEAINDILAIKDEFINKIPENIFVNRFLMLFYNRDNKTDLSEWVKIAGHVYNEVDIIDKDGKVIYRVPSIMEPLKIKEHQYAQNSVHELVEISKLHALNNPRVGEKVLEENLMKTIFIPEVKETYIERWRKIFARYNLNTTDATVETGNVVIPEVKDKIDFDDFEIA